MKKFMRIFAAMTLLSGLVFFSNCKKPDNGDEPVVEEESCVDLGLPSGIIWATCNLGAAKPEGYGDYYAWGEPTAKSNYEWSTYKYYEGGSVTKYTTTDGLVVLQADDDAAVAALGAGWRMPTKDEWDELLSKCEQEWTTKNGVKGALFTGPSGKTIFLPAAGYYQYDAVRDQGYSGRYWSSSLYPDDVNNAWRLGFNSSSTSVSSYNRCYGQTIRPVRVLLEK